MHYCTVLITKQFPTDEVINDILMPYNEEIFYEKKNEGEEIEYPIFMWDWYQLGGRYSGQIKLNIDKKEEEYKWGYMILEPRNGRLFRSWLLDQVSNAKNNSFYFEEDYFPSMGERDGFLYVDAAKIKDIKNIEEIGCFNFIDKDNRAFTREYYNGKGWVEENSKEDFEKQFHNALINSPECYACVIDIHD